MKGDRKTKNNKTDVKHAGRTPKLLCGSPWTSWPVHRFGPSWQLRDRCSGKQTLDLGVFPWRWHRQSPNRMGEYTFARRVARRYSRRPLHGRKREPSNSRDVCTNTYVNFLWVTIADKSSSIIVTLKRPVRFSVRKILGRPAIRWTCTDRREMGTLPEQQHKQQLVWPRRF